MKRILFITSYFPPSGGVGVQRITKLCKYLARDGFTPFVLMPAIKSLKRVLDQSMLEDLPGNLTVINPSFTDFRRFIPGEVAKHLKHWERRYLFPDNLIQWVKKVKDYLPQIIEKNRIDLVFITMPHFSLLDFVPTIKAAHKPVILDLRDPFSFNYYVTKTQDIAYQQRVLELERKAIESADLILTVAKHVFSTYIGLYPDVGDRFRYLPNGFDDEDFPADIPDVNTLPNPELTLCYSGSYSSMSSIMPFRDAIANVYGKHRIRIILKLVTPISEKRVRKDFEQLIAHNLLQYEGFKPHKEAVSHLLSSHVLLFPTLPMGVIPAKLYEYIRAQRPVLCLTSGESDAHMMLGKAGVGVFADLANLDSLENILLELNDRWQNKSLGISPNWEFIRSFSSEARTQVLKGWIEELLSYPSPDPTTP